MSGFLSTWVGLLSNRVGLLSIGVSLFSGERVLENMPTPLPSLSSHLIHRPWVYFREPIYPVWYLDNFDIGVRHPFDIPMHMWNSMKVFIVYERMSAKISTAGIKPKTLLTPVRHP